MTIHLWNQQPGDKITGRVRGVAKVAMVVGQAD